jgi:nicotinamidase-related amidase
LPKKILDYAQKNSFDYILLTKFVNTETSNLVKVFNWNKMMNSPDIEIDKTLSPLIEEKNVFVKHTYSIFKSKGFVKFLEDNKVGKLLFCGLDVDACVLASAYEGFDLGYKVKVINSLTGSHCGKEYEEAGLKIINKNIQK